MAELVQDCPRCGANRITFDVAGAVVVGHHLEGGLEVEVFCKCRECQQSTVFKCHSVQSIGSDTVLKYLREPGSIGGWIVVEDFVSLRDNAKIDPPEHLPKEIEACYIEGAICAQVGCFNAAGTMFRLCLDKATAAKLPPEGADGPNAKIRRSLGLRLEWLFEKGLIDRALEDLSNCIKEDGNDGAHQGSLTVEDAADLQDFADALLERLYTYPARLAAAGSRRLARRGS